MLGSVPIQRAPEGFARRVLARAERHHLMTARRPDRPVRSFRWISFAAAAVVIAAAGLGTVMLMHTIHHPGEPGDSIASDTSGDSAPVPTDDVGDTKVSPATHDDVYTRGKDAEIHKKIAKGADGLEHGKEKATAKTYNNGDYAINGKYPSAPDIAANDVVINTDDMNNARRDVEKVLLRNNIEPIVRKESTRPAKAAMSRANVFYQNKPRASQLQYVVYADRRQVPKLLEELEGVRKQQTVAQHRRYRTDLRSDLAEIKDRAESDSFAETEAPAETNEVERRTQSKLAAVKPGDDEPAAETLPAQTLPDEDAPPRGKKEDIAGREEITPKAEESSTGEKITAKNIPAEQPVNGTAAPATQWSTSGKTETDTSGVAFQDQQTVAGADVQQVLITLNYVYADEERPLMDVDQTEPSTAPKTGDTKGRESTPTHTAPAAE